MASVWFHWWLKWVVTHVFLLIREIRTKEEVGNRTDERQQCSVDHPLLRKKKEMWWQILLITSCHAKNIVDVPHSSAGRVFRIFLLELGFSRVNEYIVYGILFSILFWSSSCHVDLTQFITLILLTFLLFTYSFINSLTHLRFIHSASVPLSSRPSPAQRELLLVVSVYLLWWKWKWSLLRWLWCWWIFSCSPSEQTTATATPSTTWWLQWLRCIFFSSGEPSR